MPSRNLGHRAYFLNRELSWLEFNRRVLEEALDPKNRLLERVKFLAIFGSNLDEFFMIRVSGLRRQFSAGVLTAPPDGMSPGEQLTAIRSRLIPMLQQSTECWHQDLRPKLATEGIQILSYDDLRSNQKKSLRHYFRGEILPALTPLAFDPGHPFPHISNLSINLAVVVHDPDHGERFARVKVPHMFNRLVRLPGKRIDEGEIEFEPQTTHFVWLEEVVIANLDLLFPGLGIVTAHPFRVTRDADVEIEEDEASDLLAAMVELVGQRHFGSAVRLEVDAGMPEEIREILQSNLGVQSYQVYALEPPLARSDLMEISKIDRPELKAPVFLPITPPVLTRDESIFSVLRRQDILFYHPYDSFNPVVEFISSAARDPDVLAIKQTLYRVGPNSPIVQALREARENGKQVSALLELKARFDETNNIGWARALERAGVHVVYGLLGLKVHAKMCLIVRREKGGIRCYTHLGTGNYNPVTARLYSDLGLLTSDPTIAEDVSDLFNSLTGYSKKNDYCRLLVAPGRMRKEIIRRIDREIECHTTSGDGHIAIKINSITDRQCIKALYRASRAGVRVDLQPRGICCLRPGVEGVSENIRVTSIVGRFLEHPRILYFRNGGKEELFLGSADLMPRNLDGRVEVLFPILDRALLKQIRNDVLFFHLKDNVKARRLQRDGTYRRVQPRKDEPVIDSQALRLRDRGSWHREEGS
ncbi:MAG: polyphosphate kinase 1 [Deltaproteobacteria bacterium]|nr:polyphosphate kinase 1 [Deltaproteobacteria bacterium]